MCPFRYLHHVLLFLLSNALVARSIKWKAQFDPSETTIKTGSNRQIRLVLTGLSDEAIENINNRDYIQLRSEKEQLARVENHNEIKFFEIDPASRSWDTYFNLSGVFLGESVCTIFNNT